MPTILKRKLPIAAAEEEKEQEREFSTSTEQPTSSRSRSRSSIIKNKKPRTSSSRVEAKEDKEDKEEEDMTPHLHLIATNPRGTPFDKRVWTLLCQIPRGQTSTYASLATALGSSPRAVGNALRRNPYAPGVPCHRVVAAGGGLGGFKGQKVCASASAGRVVRFEELEVGTTLVEKRRLLRMEGVRFDARGRVVGSPFEGFVC